MHACTHGPYTLCKQGMKNYMGSAKSYMHDLWSTKEKIKQRYNAPHQS